MKNKSSMFAASQTKRFFIYVNRGSYFYGYTDAALSKDIRLSIHNGLLRSRCNFSWSRCGAIAFLICITLIFHHMTKRMKDYSGAKHSNALVTPDCESVKTLAPLAQTKSTFLPKKIISETPIGRDENGINEQRMGDIDTSTVEGSDNNVQSGNSNSIQNITQHNEHGKNIYAQTVNIYEYPKELIELLKTL
jgi:hypothetical protein